MSINFNQIFRNMVSAGQESLKSGGGEAAKYFNEVMNNQKRILEQLTKARLKREISDATLMEELEGVKSDVSKELAGLVVIGEVAIHNAWKAVTNVLTSAISKVLIP